MSYLLDTHTLIWWVLDQPELSAAAREVLENETNVVFVSPVSAMEIATKVRIGKLPNASGIAQSFEAVLADQLLTELPLRVRHARHAGAMPGEHRDPFDRMLAAQAILENLVLMSADSALDRFGVQRLW